MSTAVHHTQNHTYKKYGVHCALCTVQYTLSVHPPFLSYRQSVHCNASDGSKVDWQAQYAVACNFQSFFARQSIFQRIHSWIIWLAGSKAKTSWDWLHKKAADDMVRYGRIHFWSLEITISRPPSRVRRYNPQLNLMLWSLPSGKFEIRPKWWSGAYPVTTIYDLKPQAKQMQPVQLCLHLGKEMYEDFGNITMRSP